MGQFPVNNSNVDARKAALSHISKEMMHDGISGELLSPVTTSGQLNPGEVTVNHTGG